MKDRGLLWALGASVIAHGLVLATGGRLPAPVQAPRLIEARLAPQQVPETPMAAPARPQPPVERRPEPERPAKAPPRHEVVAPPPRLLSQRNEPAAPTLPAASGAPIATPGKADAPPPVVVAAPAPSPAAGASRPAAPPSYSPPSFGARYLDNPKPAYPMLARRRGLEGTVRLEVRVSAEGIPTAVKVRESAGHEALDDAATTAVWHWRFVPARRDGEAVEGVVVVPIRFRLGEDEAA